MSKRDMIYKLLNKYSVSQIWFRGDMKFSEDTLVKFDIF